MQNGHIESLIGKFRDECLNEHWFQTLPQARAGVAASPQDFNRLRPTAALAESRPLDSPSIIFSALAMMLKTNEPTARSIDVSTPDFPPLIGTEEGGRSRRPTTCSALVGGRLNPWLRGMLTWPRKDCSWLRVALIPCFK